MEQLNSTDYGYTPDQIEEMQAAFKNNDITRVVSIMDEQTRIARAQYVSQQKAAEQQLRAQMAILEEQQLMRAQAERAQKSLDGENRT